MKNLFFFPILITFFLVSCNSSNTTDSVTEPETEATSQSVPEEGWVSLFDGETLKGWTVSENPATFSVENGAIVAHGERAHLFYTGPAGNHNFKNFELKAQVMTMPKANAGIYFHTEFQEEGWPAKGYEVQVNNSHTDWRRTGSLYAIEDVREVPAEDNTWFTEHIIVNGKNIKIMVNGKTLVDYTEPDNPERPEDMSGRKLSNGTFALQGHDPGSKVLFKDIHVKVLAD